MENKVLFVDDQEEILELIKIKLINENYIKYYANNVHDALKILKYENIDVVVTDIVMPNLDGHDFLEILKKEYPQIIRVVLSGFSQIESIISAINNHEIFKYIAKPWKVDEAGKQLIRDAIIQSNSLNRNNTMSIETLKEILNKVNLTYEIVDSKIPSTSELVFELNRDKKIIIK